MNELMKICAIVDMQGYVIGDNFYPRELAIVRNTVFGQKYSCYEIYCDLNVDYIKKNKCQLLYQQYNIHGIPITNVLEYKTLKAHRFNELKHWLLFEYSLKESPDFPYFGIKNNHLAKLLDEYGIPYIDLQKINIENNPLPALHQFDKIYPDITYTCPLHSEICDVKFKSDEYRCSLRKCIFISKWKHNIVMRHMFGGIKPL